MTKGGKALVRFKKSRYQSGTLRKVERARGFAWEFRYYVQDGTKRTLKQITLDGSEFRTEKAARQHLHPLVQKINEGSDHQTLQTYTFGHVLTKYEAEEMPTRKSTRDSYASLIKTHIRPAWNDTPLVEMKAVRLRDWITALPLSNYGKGHVRSLTHKLFDLAMLWEYMDVQRNPVELVKVRGITKRQKRVVILSVDQYRAIVASLPQPYDVMVQVVATLGLRLSEMLGLQWTDINWEAKTITIQRSAYRGTVDEAKTEASHALLPLAEPLALVLKGWQAKLAAETDSEEGEESPWMFPNPATGKPYLGPSIQQLWIRPAGEAIGITGVGFHTFRHSYKTWLDAAGVPMGAMKDLMRHWNISVTMNTYGSTLTPEKRLHNDAIAALLYRAPA